MRIISLSLPYTRGTVHTIYSDTLQQQCGVGVWIRGGYYLIHTNVLKIVFGKTKKHVELVFLINVVGTTADVTGRQNKTQHVGGVELLLQNV